MADVTMDTVGIEVTALSDKAVHSLERLETRLNSLDKTFSVLKFGVLLKGLEQIGKVAFKSISAMGDYIETLNLFRSTMGASTQAAEKFIEKAEQVLGLDPGLMMNSVAMLQTLAEGFGLSNEEAYIMSKNLTQLAADMSSFLNIPFETAMTKVKSGLSGEVRAMRSVGVALDRATMQETMYKLGLDQTYSSLTKAQKSELLYYQMMTSTTKMQGDLARTLISPQNALRILKQEFSMLGRAIGSIFLPIAMKIIPVVRAVTQILREAAQAIASFFGFKIADYESDISDIGSLLVGVGDDIGDIGGAADSAAKSLNKMLMPFDELNNINLESASGGVGGIGAGGGVGTGGSLGIPLPEYDMFANALTSNVDKIKEKIKEFMPLIGGIATAVGTAWLSIKGIKIIGAISDFITSMRTGQKVSSTFLDTVNKLTGGGERAALSFKDVAFAMLRVASGIAGAIVSIKGLNDNLKIGTKIGQGYAATFKEQLLPMLETTLGGALIGTAIAPGIGTAIGAGVGLLAGGIAQIVAMLKGYEELQKTIIEGNLFGRATISTEEWTQALRDANSELTNYASGYDIFKSQMDSLSTNFTNAENSLENYVTKFSTGIFTITGDDLPKLTSSTEEFSDNLVSIVQASTDRSFQVLSDYYKKNDGIIDENERANLQRLVDNGNQEVEEINNIKARDLEIYQNAAAENRGFNEQEEEELREHYKRLREIADEHLKTTENSLDLYQQRVLDSQSDGAIKSLKVSKESYKNLASALKTYQEEAEKAAVTHYNELLDSQIKAGINEEAARAFAYQQYLLEEKETSDKVAEIRNKTFGEILTKYYELEGKTDEESKQMREIIENSFEDFNLNTDDLYAVMANSMATAGDIGKQNVLEHGTINESELIREDPLGLRNKSYSMANAIRSGLGYSISTEDIVYVDTNDAKEAGKIYGRYFELGLQNVSGSGTILSMLKQMGFHQFAEGGYPETGQLFLAREAGPELIGTIGNRTAVANNDQITEGIAVATYNAMARALAETGSRGSTPSTIVVNVGNRRLYEGYGEYQDEMSNMYGVTL